MLFIGLILVVHKTNSQYADMLRKTIFGK